MICLFFFYFCAMEYNECIIRLFFLNLMLYFAIINLPRLLLINLFILFVVTSLWLCSCIFVF